MQWLIVFLGLISASTAQQTFTIKPGKGVQGWCDGFDKAPSSDLTTPTTAEECFNNCKATYDTTVAIDFWDINDEGRHAGNICFCQDACPCLKPSRPSGGDGTLYIEAGTTKGESCGYDLHMIEEAVTEKGWCVGSDIKLDKTVNNQYECYAECQALHGSVAAEFFPDRDPKACFCQDECPCRMATKVGGGDGMLAIQETVTITGDLCYKLEAGVGKSGWCVGMDSAPDASLGTPTSAADCFSKCKETHPSTVAVDFYNIDHPSRNSGNICWCQDACACTMASKSDAGDGTLFVASGTVKGESCGFDMKTVVEGNDNAICDGTPTPASQKPANALACRSQCEADGFHVSTFYTAGDTACHCQGDCPCTKAASSGMGPGYLFVKDTTSMPPMCDTEMTCGDVQSAYRSGGCCGKPATMLKLR